MDGMISVQVPEPFYRRLESAASRQRRTVTDVLTAVIAVTLPPMPDIPESLANELAAMFWLSDEALRAATVPTFSADERERLNDLNAAADERSLTTVEQTERATLLTEYECSVLRRAQAFAILAQRGHPLPAYEQLRPSA